MSDPVLGTANLFGLVGESASRSLLDFAAQSGFRRVDTAPSYGHGHAEAAVGRLLRGSDRDEWTVTTKVGIEAVGPPGAAVRAAKSLARRLPASIQGRIRGDLPAGGGQFDPDVVRSSIERSRQRLGTVDRLMLHEVRPDDLTVELLDLLRAALAQGDVRAVGLATSNRLTPACANVAPDLFSVAHLAVGMRADVPTLPVGISVVGHGAFGSGGADLSELRTRSEGDDPWALRWCAVSRGTRWAGPTGLADALIVRASRRMLTGRPGRPVPVGELIVASSDAARLVRARTLLEKGLELGAELDRVLDDAFTPQDSAH